MKRIFYVLTTICAFMSVAIYAYGQEYKRLIVLGAAATEIVFALGEGEKIVGVDTTSTWPNQVQSLPKVGYLRALSAEGILSLQPDLILATEDAGPLEVLDQIRRTGGHVAIVPGKNDFPGLISRIDAIGRILNHPVEAAELMGQLDKQVSKFSKLLFQQTINKPKVLVLLATTSSQFQAAGENTAADAIVRLAGGTNAVEGYRGYKTLTQEAIISASPDIILIATSDTYQTEALLAVQSNPAIRLTPAGKSNNLYTADTVKLLGFSPRLQEALPWLIKLLHPELTDFK